MEFDWHEPKRQKTLEERGLDFVEVFPAFSDPQKLVTPDDRRDMGKYAGTCWARSVAPFSCYLHHPQG